jgi:hypothetical protein
MSSLGKSSPSEGAFKSRKIYPQQDQVLTVFAFRERKFARRSARTSTSNAQPRPTRVSVRCSSTLPELPSCPAAAGRAKVATSAWCFKRRACPLPKICAVFRPTRRRTPRRRPILGLSNLVWPTEDDKGLQWSWKAGAYPLA